VLFTGREVKEIANTNKRAQADGAIARPPGSQKREEADFASSLATSAKRPAEKVRWLTLLALPFAGVIALGLHWFAAANEAPAEALLYTYFLTGLLIAALTAVAVQPVWSGLRRFLSRRLGTSDIRAALAPVTLLSGSRWSYIKPGERQRRAFR
jgi:hypothetical protein